MCLSCTRTSEDRESNSRRVRVHVQNGAVPRLARNAPWGEFVDSVRKERFIDRWPVPPPFAKQQPPLRSHPVSTTVTIEIPPALLDALRNEELVLFIGAGLSARVKRSDGRGLPTWPQLLATAALRTIGRRAERLNLHFYVAHRRRTREPFILRLRSPDTVELA